MIEKMIDKIEDNSIFRELKHLIGPYSTELTYIVIFIFSFIRSIGFANTRYYIVAYEDDIAWIYWASQHISEPLSLLSHGVGNGYRPMVNLYFAGGYWLWGPNEAGYYLMNVVPVVFLWLYLTVLSSDVNISDKQLRSL